MARRSHLPAHVLDALPEHAAEAIGLDMAAPTVCNGKTVSAFRARIDGPSPEMQGLVAEVIAWISAHGGYEIGIARDVRLNRHPGCTLIRWHGEVTARDVAEQFAVSWTPQGLPRIPGWLSLRCEDSWDLRWQQSYGPITDPSLTIAAFTSPETPGVVDMENLSSLNETMPLFSAWTADEAAERDDEPADPRPATPSASTPNV